MATRSAKAKAWRKTVNQYFGYLEVEFSMTVIAMDASTNWFTDVTYGRDPSAVTVRHDVEDGRVEVMLVRLVGGEIPPVPIFIHPDTAIDRGSLHDLLLLRAPSEVEELVALNGLYDAVVQRALEFQASALRRHALDFLNGDTAVFSDFDRMIKARVARAPQKLTLHFPEGTSPEEVERDVGRARHIDPRVPIEVHFYRRPVRKSES